MRIEAVYLYAYEIPLSRTLAIAGEVVSHRRGLLLRVRTTTGVEAVGEIAPFPGLSVEGIEEAKAECLWWMYRLLNASAPLDPVELSGGARMWSTVAPSVQFGLSCVAAMLKARIFDLPEGMLFDRKQRTQVYVNGLLTERGTNAAEQANELACEGYKAIKLKVGRSDVDEDIATVEEVRSAVDDSISLRLDANGQWSFQEAERFADGVKGMNIEFIEEPVDYWKLLSPFHQYTHLAYAVDETLITLRAQCETRDYLREIFETDRDADELRNAARRTIDTAQAHIIKPTIFGDMQTITEFVSHCTRPASATPIICSLLESGVGRIMLANLAATLNAEVPIGIEPESILTDDILPEPLPIHDGMLDLTEANHLLDAIDYDALDLIAME